MTQLKLLTPEDLMYQIGGYTDRDAFMRMVRRSGLRRIRVNRRVIRFDPQDVEAWKRRRAAQCHKSKIVLDKTQLLGHGGAMNSSTFREQLTAKFGQPEAFDSNNTWGLGGGIGDRWSDGITVVKVFTAFTRRGKPVKALTITVSGSRIMDVAQGPKNFDLAARRLLLDRPRSSSFPDRLQGAKQQLLNSSTPQHTMDPQPASPALSWRELDALKKRLNQETIARRQSPRGSSEDVFASRMFGGRTRVFVDASGRPINQCH